MVRKRFVPCLENLGPRLAPSDLLPPPPPAPPEEVTTVVFSDGDVVKDVSPAQTWYEWGAALAVGVAYGTSLGKLP